MPQFIDIQFKSIIASESINQKLIEIIGQNSIFHGYRVIPGAARSITINHGTDSNSVLYIEGARILETDPIANIAIAANGTGSARTDTLYARYVHGDGAVCEYLIAQGATMPPSALFSCKLAEIDVPPGAVTISAGNIRMERQVSSLREVDAAVASHLAATNNPHAVTIGQIGAAAATHAHGAITTAGAIGSTANLPVITAASGVLAAGAFGSAANTFCQGNDARLSDARTPVAHNQDASTITTGTLAVARGGTGIASYTANNYIRALNSTTLEQRTPAQVLADIGAPTAAHAHGAITTAGAIGSTANLPVITAASGVLAAGAFGSTINTFCQGNDARLSDARTPTAHGHGETSAPNPNTFMSRDASGRTQVAAPAVGADIARLDTVTAHTSLTNNPHGVTAAQVGAISAETLTNEVLRLSRRGTLPGGGAIAPNFDTLAGAPAPVRSGLFPQAVAPAAVSVGGSLVYTGGDFIYALQGGTTAFWRYSIAGNSWTTMTVAPAAVGWGGSLVYTGGDFIYALQGNTTAFWLYSISANIWGVGLLFVAGGSLVYTGGDFIYALQGNDTTAFWRYSIAGNSWTTMTVAPAAVSAGGSLVYTGGDFIYALRGNGTTAFWRYSIAGNSWMVVTSTPLPASGAITNATDLFAYILRGDGTTTFWRAAILPQPV